MTSISLTKEDMKKISNTENLAILLDISTTITNMTPPVAQDLIPEYGKPNKPNLASRLYNKRSKHDYHEIYFQDRDLHERSTAEPADRRAAGRISSFTRRA
jgi:hypothetical protein